MCKLIIRWCPIAWLSKAVPAAGLCKHYPTAVKVDQCAHYPVNGDAELLC